MSDSAEVVARAFVDAINRQDVEGLAGLMTPEHRFVDSLGGVLVSASPSLDVGRAAALPSRAGSIPRSSIGRRPLPSLKESSEVTAAPMSGFSFGWLAEMPPPQVSGRISRTQTMGIMTSKARATR